MDSLHSAFEGFGVERLWFTTVFGFDQGLLNSFDL
jgi:hypothetical protein